MCVCVCLGRWMETEERLKKQNTDDISGPWRDEARKKIFGKNSAPPFVVCCFCCCSCCDRPPSHLFCKRLKWAVFLLSLHYVYIYFDCCMILLLCFFSFSLFICVYVSVFFIFFLHSLYAGAVSSVCLFGCMCVCCVCINQKSVSVCMCFIVLLTCCYFSILSN